MKGKDERSGEKTRLIMRDASTFKLNDDTHVLKKTPITSHKKPSSPHERNLTGLSEGDVTTISTGVCYDNVMKKKSKRRKRRVSTTKVLIGLCYLFVLCYTCVILIGPLRLSFQEESDWCPVYHSDDGNNLESSPVFNWDVPIQDREYANPDFIRDPCHYARVPQLFWLTLEECDYSLRMLTSVILGGVIG